MIPLRALLFHHLQESYATASPLPASRVLKARTQCQVAPRPSWERSWRDVRRGRSYLMVVTETKRGAAADSDKQMQSPYASPPTGCRSIQTSGPRGLSLAERISDGFKLLLRLPTRRNTSDFMDPPPMIPMTSSPQPLLSHHLEECYATASPSPS
ncbi:hypothetical protein FA95DRAFT_886498 [Auriscalpium vulgare]|uniref:Uncharacterized protein n=1 Tax=Auriscalpium vulgare TaxID=40419 RepID=A0ACB8R8M6_9AGAM|nr:hypothetical protein FA95DRAFT_886498 [Auriscalpium vulgare]